MDDDLNYKGVSMTKLPESLKEPLLQWRENVLTGDGKQGLWVFGKRTAGTTYASQVIYKRMAFQEDRWDPPMTLTDAKRVMAIDLVELVRASWQAAASIRQYGDDFAVFTEAQSVQDRLFHLFYDLRLLWIDDLHHETIDWSIYRKNIQPYVERRVKMKMPTIVSTSLPPVHDFLPGKVIDTHFITVYVKTDGAG